MALGNTPAVFVSSTFYDLKQIRNDLKQFIESLGYEPILSEEDTFPIDPDENTIENCLRIVDENADILVLIVGSRYGSLINEQKSVTNHEFLRAKAKGIPVYVFVEKEVLTLTGVWNANKDKEISTRADSTKLYEFVEFLRTQSGVWVFGFEIASEISSTLRKQLAYLFRDGLKARRLLRSVPDSPVRSNLSGKSLRLMLEKPDMWEYLLFFHVLKDEISLAKTQKWDRQFGIVIGKGEYIENIGDLMRWTLQKFADARRFFEQSEALIKNPLVQALGPEGHPGDAEMIVYVAMRLGAIYAETLEWSLEVSRAHLKRKSFLPLRSAIGEFVDEIIESLESFAKDNLSILEDAIQQPPVDGDKRVIEAILTLTVPESASRKANEAIEQLRLLSEDGDWQDEDTDND